MTDGVQHFGVFANGYVNGLGYQQKISKTDGKIRTELKFDNWIVVRVE